MDVIDELSLVVSESAHMAALQASSEWRSRVTHRHTNHDTMSQESFTTGGRGFQKKYPNLGDTKGVRIPYEISTQIVEISQHLDDICGRHDADYVHKVLDKILEGLQRIP